MLFVPGNSLSACTLRGQHLADFMGVPWLPPSMGQRRLRVALEAESNQTIVFVKMYDIAVLTAAKGRGNRIIYDVLDFLCYKDRPVPFGELVDVLIVQNPECIDYYRTVFPNAEFAYIPHQWDYRI